jgi:ribosomal protein S6--L-glutamate ligase
VYGTAIVRQFEIMQVFSAVKSLAIVRSRDKLRSLQILSKAGVGLPKTAFANHPRDIEGVINQVGGVPVVIKLLEGTQGIGVMLADSRKAAKSIIEAFYGLKADILIQEFIKESAGADIRAFVVDGKVVGAMKRQGKEDDFRSNLHRGGSGVLIKLSKQEKETALAAANALGLAVAGVDMLQSRRGPLVMEVNSSPGLQGIETATQVDIAGKIIQYVEKNIKVKTKDKVGV